MTLYQKRKLEDFKKSQKVVDSKADFVEVYATKMKEHETQDKLNQLRRLREKKLKKKRLMKGKFTDSEEEEAEDNQDFDGDENSESN